MHRRLRSLSRAKPVYRMDWMELACNFVASMSSAAFVQRSAVLNIVIDKQIIVTNSCYTKIGSIVVLPSACAGRPFLISEGAVSAKSCECSVQENRRTPPSPADLQKLFRHRGDVQPGHQPALSGRPALHAAGL